MRFLNSDLRWCRDRLVALSAAAMVASLMLVFGLVPSTASASVVQACSGLDGSQGPLFFVPSSNSDTSLQPTPASGSTVDAGSTVYAIYHDETDLGIGHNLTFTYSGPTSGSVTPIFTTLSAGTGFDTMTPAHDDAWIPAASNSGIHPDQEFNHVVKISGVIPNLTTAGDYNFHLQTYDGDNNSDLGDCGFADWKLHVKAVPDVATTASAGGPIGTLIHDTATVSGGESPTGTVTFRLYAPGAINCDATPVFTDANVAISGGLYTSSGYSTLKVGTYQWRATYNGDDNNASVTTKCGDEPVVITKAQPEIDTAQSDGGVIGVVISDTATLSGGYNPTGTVTFKLFAPNDGNCETPLSLPDPTEDLSGLSAISDSHTSTVVGIYHWIATYNGDANNLSASSPCGEPVSVGKASPGIETTPSAGGVVGTAIHDTAVVSGGHNPTGTVTFKLYTPTDSSCESNVPLFSDTKALGVASAGYTTTAVGTYSWTATYNGDANNNSATSGCQDEHVVTTKAEDTLATVAVGANLVAGSAGTVGDSATFSGAYHPTGSVDFTLYNSDCSQSTGVTGSGAISDAGTASFSASWTSPAAGTYSWRATYLGDANNVAVTTACNDANEQVTVSAPPVGGTQGAVKAATIQVPNTGNSELAGDIVLAIVLVFAGVAALAGEAIVARRREGED